MENDSVSMAQQKGIEADQIEEYEEETESDKENRIENHYTPVRRSVIA